MEDVVEKPKFKTLFRQSSLEMRLYPSTPHSDSDEESENEVEPPRIVDVIMKSNPSQVDTSEVPTIKTQDEEGEGNVHKEVKNTSEITVEENKTNKSTVNELLLEKQEDEKWTAHHKESNETKDNIDQSSSNGKDFKENVSTAFFDSAEEHGKVVEQCSSQPEQTNIITVTPNHEHIVVLPSLEETKTSEELQQAESQEMSSHNNEDHSLEALSPPNTSYGESVGTIKGITQRKKTKATMASPRPKSPRPVAARRDDKEESFWDKIGTLGRKKKIKEVQEVQDEGKYAIDSPGSPTAPDLPPEEYALEENEERSMIEPRSFEDQKLKELMFVLIDWINDELADQRIIVKDIEEDLYDGQVLQKLLEKLTGEKLDVPEVTQSEEGQKQKLRVVLDVTNKVLGLPRWSQQKWSVESIHSKNIVAILHLLVALARHFRAPIRLPENVSVGVVVVQKRDGQLTHRTVREEITAFYDDVGMRCERDAFDTLFDHAPDKLQVVKKSLVTFVNKHLNKVNLEVNDLDHQFHDGVYLTLLMGLLEGFFVPLYNFHLTPQDNDQKIHNVSFAFELMQDVGLAKPKARPEDIVNLDLKSTLRVLYNLFTKYKNLS